MRITIESKGEFNKVKGWLAGVVNRSPVNALRQVAAEGERELARNTPKDTGETASGWTSEITTTRGSAEVSWYNTAHPHTSVNIAKVIDLGHGTGTGGYVPPRPYIVDSMTNVWKKFDDTVSKELFK